MPAKHWDHICGWTSQDPDIPMHGEVISVFGKCASIFLCWHISCTICFTLWARYIEFLSHVSSRALLLTGLLQQSYYFSTKNFVLCIRLIRLDLLLRQCTEFIRFTLIISWFLCPCKLCQSSSLSRFRNWPICKFENEHLGFELDRRWGRHHNLFLFNVKCLVHGIVVLVWGC